MDRNVSPGGLQTAHRSEGGTRVSILTAYEGRRHLAAHRCLFEERFGALDICHTTTMHREGLRHRTGMQAGRRRLFHAILSCGNFGVQSGSAGVKMTLQYNTTH